MSARILDYLEGCTDYVTAVRITADVHAPFSPSKLERVERSLQRLASEGCVESIKDREGGTRWRFVQRKPARPVRPRPVVAKPASAEPVIADEPPVEAKEADSEEEDQGRGHAELTEEIARRIVRTLGNQNLRGFRKMRPEVARLLARSRGELEFRNLPMTKEILDALADHEGGLVWRGLEAVSGDLGAALAAHQGAVRLPDLRRLQPTQGNILLARKLADGPDHLVLQISSLPTEIAEALSSHAGRLVLTRLTKIDSASAQALAAHKGRLELPALRSLDNSPGHVALTKKLVSQPNGLALQALNSLGGAPALLLAAYKGPLSLPAFEFVEESVPELKSLLGARPFAFWGIRRLTEHHAASIVREGGSRDLTLPFSEVDEAAATILARSSGALRMPNLKSLEGTRGHRLLANKLAELEMCELPELVRLDPAAAERLLDTHLCLRSLERIDEALAETLARCNKSLVLPRIKRLEPKQAYIKLALKLVNQPVWTFTDSDPDSEEPEWSKGLDHYIECLLDDLKIGSRYAQDFFLDLSSRFSFFNLTRVNRYVALHLSEVEGHLQLPSLQYLDDSSAHLDLARRLARQDVVVLDSLESLGAQAAAVLAESSDVQLNGLKSLTGPAAAGLARNTGRLSLDGVTALGWEASQQLSQHRGYLTMRGLQRLENMALAKKMARQERAELLSLETVTPEVRDVLATGRAKINAPKLGLSKTAA